MRLGSAARSCWSSSARSATSSFIPPSLEASTKLYGGHGPLTSIRTLAHATDVQDLLTMRAWPCQRHEHGQRQRDAWRGQFAAVPRPGRRRTLALDVARRARSAAAALARGVLSFEHVAARPGGSLPLAAAPRCRRPRPQRRHRQLRPPAHAFERRSQLGPPCAREGAQRLGVVQQRRKPGGQARLGCRRAALSDEVVVRQHRRAVELLGWLSCVGALPPGAYRWRRTPPLSGAGEPRQVGESRAAAASSCLRTDQVLGRGQHHVQAEIDQVHARDRDRRFAGEHHAPIEQPIGQLEQRDLVRVGCAQAKRVGRGMLETAETVRRPGPGQQQS